ncbi:MAG: iron ABC transporter permease [Chloroflexota bacterium]|nr:MAG: iron ABC transporter permease [Chloroflexota bacterium]
MTLEKPIIFKNAIRMGLLWILPLLFLGIFYFFPLGSILKTSFNRSESGVITPILEAIQSGSIQEVLWFTIWQAALSTLLTLMIGLPGAYLFARYDFRGKTMLQALSTVPFVIPTVVVAAAFYALLGSRGWLNLAAMRIFNLQQAPIQITNTIYAILLAHIFYNTTIVLRMVGDFWSHISPRLNQAARTLGASRSQAFSKVTLPLIGPAIASAALLVFIFDFTSFGVILILGGPQFATLEVEIYYQTISLFNLPLAAVLSLLQLGCTLILTIIYTQLSHRLTLPLELRARTFTQKKLHSWRSRIFAGIVIMTLFTILLSPLLALAMRSFTRFEPERGERKIESPGFTTDFYQELSINQRSSLFYVPPTTAIGISLSYAAASVVLALLIGLPAAWALSHHSGSFLNRVLDPILMLPIGTSAVTLGLGFIIALNRPPFDLRASPILVPIAHTLVAFPFVVRSLTPALRSIQPRLRQAAAVLGASPAQVVREIDVPLIGRALIVAAAFAFTISLGEFGATALISRPEYPTIPLVIYRFISQPGALNYGQAMALSTILMVVTAGGLIAIERFRIADVGEF